MVELKSKDIERVEKGPTKKVDQKEKEEPTYKLDCPACGKNTEFKVVSFSRKIGVRVKCLKCGETMNKNIKYLQNKKNGN